MKPINSCPLEDCFAMPFEGDGHQGTLMLLPYRQDTWRDNAEPARNTFKQIVKAIARFEKVYLGVHPSIPISARMEFLMDNVQIIELPYNDAWARDTMPVFVRNGKTVRGVDFRFNAWGGRVDGLYDDYQDDDLLAARICKILGFDYYHLDDFILEGGSIHSDGEGTLLVTESCLLSKGRNPTLSKEDIEGMLKRYLGMKKVIWLPRGIHMDETNEHVDNVACFLAPARIALAWCDDEADPQYELSLASYERLRNETDALGRKMEIIKFPLPSPALFMKEDEAKGIIAGDKNAKERLANSRLAASYINFYQGKDFVILPGFGIKEDQKAYELIKKLYPQKEIIQVQTREVLLGGGNIHCITMQIPE